MARFSEVDDLLHDISHAPHGRESYLWTAPLPAHRLLVFAYAFRDADTDRFGRIVVVAGDEAREPLHLSVSDDHALEGDDMRDAVVGGLHVRQPEALRTAHIAYESDDGTAFDVRFEGLHEPFSWHENEGGCPAWAADDRYEQSCRTSGTVRVDGREIAFDGFGHRDHSWGTRDWRALQHWKWMNATTSDGEASLHAWISFALGDVQVNGYVNRGGTVTPLVDLVAHADLDDHMLHTAVRATLIDADGGETVLEARRAAIWQMPIRHLYLNEAAMTATIDGREAVAHVELGWPQAYVDEYVES